MRPFHAIISLLALSTALPGTGCSDGESYGATPSSTTTADSVGGSGGVGGSNAGGGDVGGAGGAGGSETSAKITTYLGDVQANLRFVAFQEGDGSWSALTGLGGTYTVMHGANRYGIAYACLDAPTVSSVFVQFAGPTDPLPTTLGCVSEKLHTVSGSISSLSGTWSAIVSTGPGTAGGATNQTPSFTVNAHEGVSDVFLSAWSYTASAEIFMRKDAMSISQDLTIDLDAVVGGIPATPWQGSLANAPSGDLNASCTLWSNLGTYAGFAEGGTTFYCMPDAALTFDDIHIISGTVVDPPSGLARTHRAFTRTASDQLFEMPELDATLTATPNVLALTPLRISLDLPMETGSQEYYLWVSTNVAYWAVDATASWVESKGTAHLETPDFAGLSGWDAAFSLVPDGRVPWYSGVRFSSQSASSALPKWPQRPTPDLDGQWEKQAFISGTIQP